MTTVLIADYFHRVVSDAQANNTNHKNAGRTRWVSSDPLCWLGPELSPQAQDAYQTVKRRTATPSRHIHKHTHTEPLIVITRTTSPNTCDNFWKHKFPVMLNNVQTKKSPSLSYIYIYIHIYLYIYMYLRKYMRDFCFYICVTFVFKFFICT